MSIIAACRCGQKFVFKDEFAGRNARCRRCGAVFHIAAPSAPSQTADEEIGFAPEPAAASRQARGKGVANQPRDQPDTSRRESKPCPQCGRELPAGEELCWLCKELTTAAQAGESKDLGRGLVGDQEVVAPSRSQIMKSSGQDKSDSATSPAGRVALAQGMVVPDVYGVAEDAPPPSIRTGGFSAPVEGLAAAAPTSHRAERTSVPIPLHPLLKAVRTAGILGVVATTGLLFCPVSTGVKALAVVGLLASAVPTALYCRLSLAREVIGCWSARRSLYLWGFPIQQSHLEGCDGLTRFTGVPTWEKAVRRTKDALLALITLGVILLILFFVVVSAIQLVNSLSAHLSAALDSRSVAQIVGIWLDTLAETALPTFVVLFGSLLLFSLVFTLILLLWAAEETPRETVWLTNAEGERLIAYTGHDGGDARDIGRRLSDVTGVELDWPQNPRGVKRDPAASSDCQY